MELIGDLIELQPLQAEDLEIFHETNIAPSVRRYLWDDEVITEDTALKIIEQSLEFFKTEGRGLWKILRLPDHIYTGYAGLWHFFEKQALPQLIYALLPTNQSKGYATSAAQLIIDHAFTNLNYPELCAAVDAPNQKSHAVLKRLGFQLVDTRPVDNKPTCFYRLHQLSHAYFKKIYSLQRTDFYIVLILVLCTANIERNVRLSARDHRGHGRGHGRGHALFLLK